MKRIVIVIFALLTLMCFVGCSCNDTSAITCIKCGYENLNNVKFCANCGTSLMSVNNDNQSNSNNQNTEGTNGTENSGTNSGNNTDKEQVEEFSFTLSSDNSYYIITGIGTCQKADIIIPSTYKNLPIKRIAESAFKNQTHITSIIVPDNIEYIGAGAFSGCSNLTTLEIPFVGDSKKTASDCYQYPLGYVFGTSQYSGGVETTQYYFTTDRTKSEIYYIPSKLASVTVNGGNILDYAFRNCENIKTIKIGSKVGTFGSYSFGGCENLEKVYIYDLAKWCQTDFSETYSNPLSYGADLYVNNELVTKLVTPRSISKIEEDAFIGCNSITSLEITSNIQEIGQGAFTGCDNLICVEFSANSFLKTLPKSAFSNCSKLRTVSLPSSLERIGEYAFDSCKELMSIEINSIIIISDYAFLDCGRLVEVVNNSGSPYIKKGDTNNGKIAMYAQTVHSGKSKLVIENGFAFITGDDGINYLVNYLQNDTAVNLPNYYKGSVYKINRYAFASKTNIKTVHISSGVQEIGAYAFNNCSSLTNVSIPDTISSIALSSFSECENLEYTRYGNALYLGNKSNPYLVLVGTEKLTIATCTIHAKTKIILQYAFDDCVGLYQAYFEDPNGWKVYTDYTSENGTTPYNLDNAETAASYLISKYYWYFWRKG